MPLSKLQVALMDRADQESAAGGSPEESDWQDAITLSIAGIAAAMQSTG
jgi:phosphoenolpyruvate carboxylase